MNDAMAFYDYVSRSLERLDGYTINDCYTYTCADTGTDVFIELEHDNAIIIGYKGSSEKGKAASVLDRRHFNRKYFSDIIIDVEHDKIYKRYLFKHDATDELKNIIETVFIHNSLAELKIEYEKE
jgi:hypothetical protein